MSLIKGKELKKLYGEVFYKIISDNCTHNNYIYKLGENVDSEEFNPDGECCCGGLYFTTKENVRLYTTYGTKVGIININDKEDVWCETDKFKVHRLCLLEIISLEEYINTLGEDEIVKYVSANEKMFELVKNQTYSLCLKIVKQNGQLIKYIENQTEIICIEAVKENGMALEFVKDQNEIICLEAVRFIK